MRGEEILQSSVSVFSGNGMNFDNFIPIYHVHSCCYRDERKPH